MPELKMWLVSNRDINFLLLCISVIVFQLSYCSVDTEWMAGNVAAQSGSALDSNSEAFGKSAQVETLKCYNVLCSGEDCLYLFIRNITDTSSFTCAATGPDVCYILVESGAGGVSITAGCGVDCGPAVNISNPIVQGNNTLPPDLATTTDSGQETKKTTSFFEPKRRRKRDVTPRRECCYSNHCNHDSPCGQLTCSAGFSTVPNILLYMYMFLAVSFNKF